MSDEQGQPGITDVPPNEGIFDLLSHPRRRIVLALLDTHERRLTLNDLTKAIVERERAVPMSAVPGEELTRVSIALHHKHLPKLAEGGVVEYDAERRMVAPTEELDRVDPSLLSILEEEASVMTLDRRE